MCSPAERRRNDLLAGSPTVDFAGVKYHTPANLCPLDSHVLKAGADEDGYTDNVIEHYGALEGVEFIQKPFSPEDLAVKVRAVLGSPTR